MKRLKAGRGPLGRAARMVAVALACLAAAGLLGGTACARSEATTFTIGPGQRYEFGFTVSVPGTISADVSWSGSAQSLALMLNGPGQVGYYRREDGPSPLAVVQQVTGEILARGTSWKVTVANFGSGWASGNLTVGYPAIEPVYPTADSLWNPRITASGTNYVDVTFDYSYGSMRPHAVFVGAGPLGASGDYLPLFAFGPVRAVAGSHQETVRVSYTGAPGTGPRMRQVELFMYEAGQLPFLARRFALEWDFAGGSGVPPGAALSRIRVTLTQLVCDVQNRPGRAGHDMPYFIATGFTSRGHRVWQIPVARPFATNVRAGNAVPIAPAQGTVLGQGGASLEIGPGDTFGFHLALLEAGTGAGDPLNQLMALILEAVRQKLNEQLWSSPGPDTPIVGGTLDAILRLFGLMLGAGDAPDQQIGEREVAFTYEQLNWMMQGSYYHGFTRVLELSGPARGRYRITYRVERVM